MKMFALASAGVALSLGFAPVSVNADYLGYLSKAWDAGFDYARKDDQTVSVAEVKKTIDGIGSAFEEFKKAHQQQIDELRKKGAPDPLTTEKVEKLTTELAELKSVKDKLERVLARAENPGLGGNQKGEKSESVRDFERAMRSKAGWAQMEAKAVDADFANDSTSGGVAVPEEINREIAQQLLQISPLRGIVRVTQVSSPNYKRLVDTRGLASGWVGETTSRTETGTPTLEEVTFTHGELYALPKASQWSLNDLFFDVTRWLIDSVAEEFAYQEGVAIATGNGTNKPTGFLSGSPVSTSDTASPARSFGVLQYVPTGAAATLGAAVLKSSPVVQPADIFITTAYTLKAGYRRNARWLMNKSTLGTVMKMKDGDGNYVWRPGLAAGQPDTLIGYPITEAEAMSDIGANAFPIAFGDFMKGYELIDIVGMQMIRDDVTSKGNVIFYVSRRLGGKVVDDDAIKLIKCATS